MAILKVRFYQSFLPSGFTIEEDNSTLHVSDSSPTAAKPNLLNIT